MVELEVLLLGGELHFGDGSHAVGEPLVWQAIFAVNQAAWATRARGEIAQVLQAVEILQLRHAAILLDPRTNGPGSAGRRVGGRIHQESDVCATPATEN